MTGNLQQLIDMFQNLAPELWKIALQQVYNVILWDKIGAGIFGFFFLICIGVILSCASKIGKEKGRNPYNKNEIYRWNWDDFSGRLVTSIIIGAIALIGVIIELVSVGMYMSNPQWYAIYFLLHVAK